MKNRYQTKGNINAAGHMHLLFLRPMLSYILLVMR